MATLSENRFGDVAAATAEALTSMRFGSEEKDLLNAIREGLGLFKLLEDANKTLREGAGKVGAGEYNSYRIVKEAFYTEQTVDDLQKLVSSFLEEVDNIRTKLEELLGGRKLSEEDLKICRKFFLKLAIATGL